MNTSHLGALLLRGLDLGLKGLSVLVDPLKLGEVAVQDLDDLLELCVCEFLVLGLIGGAE